MSTITSLDPVSVAPYQSAIAISLNLAHKMFEHMRRNASDSEASGQEAYQAWILLRLTAEMWDLRKSLTLTRPETADLERALEIAHRAGPFLYARDIARLRSLLGAGN